MIGEKGIATGERRRLSAYGMFVFFLLLPFEYPLATFGVGSILRYAGMAVMALAAWDVFYLGGKVRLDYRILLLAAWMVYAIVSGLWSADQELYRRYISMYINNALMFLVITAVDYTPKDAKLVMKGLIGGVVLLLLYMIFIPGAVTSSSWQSRLTLAYKGRELLDQNYLAALMLMPLGIVFYDLLNTKYKKFRQVVMSAFIIVVLYYILRTGSRGGVLAAGMVAFLCICLGLKKRRAITWILLGIILVLTPAVLNVLPDDLLERFSLQAMMGHTSESGGRLQIWRIAWETIKTGNFVFGYGAGASETVIGWDYYKDAAVHNALIAQMLELGLVGLTLFVGLIIKMLQELKKYEYKKLIYAFSGILVASMFLDVLTTKFFWSGMMMLTVQINALRNSPTQAQTEESIKGYMADVAD